MILILQIKKVKWNTSWKSMAKGHPFPLLPHWMPPRRTEYFLLNYHQPHAKPRMPVISSTSLFCYSYETKRYTWKQKTSKYTKMLQLGNKIRYDIFLLFFLYLTNCLQLILIVLSIRKSKLALILLTRMTIRGWFLHTFKGRSGWEMEVEVPILGANWGSEKTSRCGRIYCGSFRNHWKYSLKRKRDLGEIGISRGKQSLPEKIQPLPFFPHQILATPEHSL